MQIFMQIMQSFADYEGALALTKKPEDFPDSYSSHF